MSRDVAARVETIRPGDRVYTPRGPDTGYEVERVVRYDDGAIVVVYSTGQWLRNRFAERGESLERELRSLAPLRAGERLRARRGATPPLRAPAQRSA